MNGGVAVRLKRLNLGNAIVRHVEYCYRNGLAILSKKIYGFSSAALVDEIGHLVHVQGLRADVAEEERRHHQHARPDRQQQRQDGRQ